MQLTRFSDYALRTLLYLGAHPGEVVSAPTISAAYGISNHHLVKAAKWLTQRGYVRTHRGKTGGLSLGREPGEISIGELIRETEPNLDLLECFDPATATCPITPVCRLRVYLEYARDAFFRELEDVTLADLLWNAPELVRILAPRAAARREDDGGAHHR